MNLQELKERFERRLLDENETKFLFSKVEEMQKALEWYADEENYDLSERGFYIPTKLDRGERTRDCLKGAPHEPLTIPSQNNNQSAD